MLCDLCSSSDIGSLDEGMVWFCRSCGTNDIRPIPDPKAIIPIPVIGHSIDDDDMRWTARCPECGIEHEFEGFFDSSDTDRCKCGCSFRVERVVFEDGSFLE